MSAWTRRALACLVVLLPLSGSAASAHDGAAPLVEATTCAAPTPVAATDARSADGTTLVSLQVPAVTRLRVADGAVVAAATNTGCAPRSTDVFVVGDRYATPAEVATGLLVRTGDWTTPGTFHAIAPVPSDR